MIKNSSAMPNIISSHMQNLPFDYVKNKKHRKLPAIDLASNGTTCAFHMTTNELENLWPTVVN